MDNPDAERTAASVVMWIDADLGAGLVHEPQLPAFACFDGLDDAPAREPVALLPIGFENSQADVRNRRYGRIRLLKSLSWAAHCRLSPFWLFCLDYYGCCVVSQCRGRHFAI